MVDHSALVIAIYNGTKGGTRNTIEYAERHGINVEVYRAWGEKEKAQPFYACGLCFLFLFHCGLWLLEAERIWIDNPAFAPYCLTRASPWQSMRGLSGYSRSKILTQAHSQLSWRNATTDIGCGWKSIRMLGHIREGSWNDWASVRAVDRFFC